MPKDDKDWTWVLERPCPDGGFDASATAPEDATGMLRDNAAAWVPSLADPLVATRPSGDILSALEYGCHVRDVFHIYDERLRRMLSEDNPVFPNWDQDETAAAGRYGEQSPPQVVEELQAASEKLADRFGQVAGDDWQRTGRRSDGASFTIDTFSRYLIHDPVHHLHDVHKGFRALRG